MRLMIISIMLAASPAWAGQNCDALLAKVTEVQGRTLTAEQGRALDAARRELSSGAPVGPQRREMYCALTLQRLKHTLGESQ